MMPRALKSLKSMWVLRALRVNSNRARMAGERGSATIIALLSAFLLIGVSALVALEIAEIGARRAETRKIEALGLAVMERAGGSGALACQLAEGRFDIPCVFGGEEIALYPKWSSGSWPIRVGWRAQEQGIW
jgi:hypothetical protein